MVTPFPNMVYFRPGRLDSFVPYSSTGRPLSSSTYPYPYLRTPLFRSITPLTPPFVKYCGYTVYSIILFVVYIIISTRGCMFDVFRHQRISFYSRSLRPPELSPGPGAEERRTPSAFVSWVQPVQPPRFWPILCTKYPDVSRQTDFQTTQHVNQDDRFNVSTSLQYLTLTFWCVIAGVLGHHGVAFGSRLGHLAGFPRIKLQLREHLVLKGVGIVLLSSAISWCTRPTPPSLVSFNSTYNTTRDLYMYSF